jgi:hypothetical protein
MSRYCSATISVVCFGSNCNTKMVKKVCIMRYFGPFSGRAWPDLGLEIKYFYLMIRKETSAAKCLFLTVHSNHIFKVYSVSCLKGKF